MQTLGRFSMWVAPKRNRPSFCVILRLSHAMDGLFSGILSRLYGLKHKCAFCWMKHHWMWLLSDIVVWDSFNHGVQYLFLDIDSGESPFPDFVKYMFPQLQTGTALILSADCTEGSCLTSIVIYNNFSVFNFPIFNFEQYFPFPWISILSSLIFNVVLHYQLNAFKISKMV